MSELFVSFYMLKTEINNALKDGDVILANQLKQKQSSLFTKILSVKADTLENRKMLGLFLMDQLKEETPEKEVRAIRKRIIELFWEAPVKLNPEFNQNSSVEMEMTPQQRLDALLGNVIV